MVDCQSNPAECRILPCSCRSENSCKIIPINEVTEQECHQRGGKRLWRRVLVHNITQINRLVKLPYVNFWSNLLYGDSKSIRNFLLHSTFKCKDHEDLINICHTHVYFLCKRIYNPTYLNDTVKDTNKLESWIANKWAQLSLVSGITGLDVLFNLLHTVIYPNEKYRLGIKQTLCNFFSMDVFSRILNVSFQAYSMLIKTLNDNFKDVFTFNSMHTILNLYALNTDEHQFILSKNIISLVITATSNFDVLFSTCPSLSLIAFNFQNGFLLNASIAYKNINLNIFPNISILNKPLSQKNFSHALLEQFNSLLLIPSHNISSSIKLEPFIAKDILLQLKSSLLKLVESCIWYIYGTNLLDSFNDKNHTLPPNITRSNKNNLALSSIEVATKLIDFSNIFVNIEVQEKLPPSDKLNREYAYFLNCPLIADINFRLNLFARVDYISKSYFKDAIPYCITYVLTLLQNFNTCSYAFINKKDSPKAVNNESTSKIKTLDRVFNKISFHDTRISELIISVFDNDSFQSIMFATEIFKRIDTLSEQEIFYIAHKTALSHERQRSLLNDMFGDPSTSASEISKTLALEEKIYQDDILLQKSFNNYEDMMANSPLLSSNANILEKYFTEDRSVFSKEFRKSKLREQLRNETGLDDSQIDGWYFQYKRLFGDTNIFTDDVANEVTKNIKALSSNNNRNNKNIPSNGKGASSGSKGASSGSKGGPSGSKSASSGNKGGPSGSKGASSGSKGGPSGSKGASSGSKGGPSGSKGGPSGSKGASSNSKSTRRNRK